MCQIRRFSLATEKQRNKIKPLICIPKRGKIMSNIQYDQYRISNFFFTTSHFSFVFLEDCLAAELILDMTKHFLIIIFF